VGDYDSVRRRSFPETISDQLVLTTTSYNRVNGPYASENAHLLQDILRREWNFDGLIMSDW
jgi:beta-glucosidase-like glycosyl hydrolase